MKHDKEKEREEARRAGGGGRKKEFDPFAANKAEEEAYKNHSWGKQAGGGDGEGEEGEDAGPKQEKNFGLSGLLAKETRMWQGIELKFTEPAEGRMPTLRSVNHALPKPSERRSHSSV